MHIDLLHLPDCPNVHVARERLRVALDRAGVTAAVRDIEVDSADAAEAAGMHGSPTILIDGADPFALDAMEATMSCRLFRTTDGIDGAPSVDQLVEVLAR